MIELFSILLNLQNLKPRFSERLTYKDVCKLKSHFWSNFGPKMSKNNQNYIILSKNIMHGDFWYRVGIRLERTDKDIRRPPTDETVYQVKGLVPLFVYKLEQKGLQFNLLETYKSKEDSVITDYIKEGVPEEILHFAIDDLNKILV